MTELTDFTTIIAVLGVLAFLVSVITQVTKEMWFLDKIPTALQVTVLSVVLTVVAYLHIYHTIKYRCNGILL